MGENVLAACCESANCLYCENKCEYKILQLVFFFFFSQEDKLKAPKAEFVTGQSVPHYNIAVLLGAVKLGLSALRG